MNIVEITREEFQEAADPDSRAELLRSKGLPVRDNGTLDNDNFTIMMKKVVLYRYKWAPIDEVFIRAVNGPQI